MRSLRTAVKSSPHSPQLERARVQQRRPSAAKNLKKKKKKANRPCKAKMVVQKSILCVCVCVCVCIYIWLRGLRGLISPARDRTWALSSESTESQPLDLQGNAHTVNFKCGSHGSFTNRTLTLVTDTVSVPPICPSASWRTS